MFNQYLCSALKKKQLHPNLGGCVQCLVSILAVLQTQTIMLGAQFKILTSVLGLKHVTIPLTYLVACSDVRWQFCARMRIIFR